MVTPAFVSPAVARVAIPVAQALAYGLCHWWRWRTMHPKIIVGDLPKPAESIVPVGQRQDADGNNSEGKASARVLSAKRETRWEDRRKQEIADEMLDLEACDVGCLVNTYQLVRRRRPRRADHPRRRTVTRNARWGMAGGHLRRYRRF